MRLIKQIVFIFGFVFFVLTNSAFVSADTGTVRMGDANENVYTLQSELKKIGFYQYEIDGTFGSLTKSAVLQFQQAAGITADGVAGPGTWRALRNYSTTNEVSRGKLDRGYGQQIASFAQRFLGVPYVWAGSSAAGFDCSGFVYYVYSNFGITVPRMADEQYSFGRNVPLADIQPGDLVFYSTYAPGASHVGIYIGNGQFIHASSGAGEVTITPLSKPYYQARFVGATRVVR